MDNIFALVDCNNFFCSCERVFNPKIKTLPVMVLSNNDGCAVARSQEVKDLGITMGQPAFKCKDLIKSHNIQVLSSNYALYADMSKRVMTVLSEFTPQVEIYSIDEAFLALKNIPIKDYSTFGRNIIERVRQCTDIPVSVGIANTKTLSKIANGIAKKNKQFNGVVSFINLSNTEIDNLLQKVPVKDIWGIGRNYANWLIQNNITNAFQLKYADKKMIKQHMTIMGEKMLMELNGISCFKLEDIQAPKKAIASTRSFGKYVTTYRQLEEAVSTYTARAGEKLRSQKSLTNLIQVFIHTNKYNKNHQQYYNCATIKLPFPTSYTPSLIHFALYGLKNIYKKEFFYQKAGVVFLNIQPEAHIQYDLLNLRSANQVKMELTAMNIVDNLNRKWGKGTVVFGSQGIIHKWDMRQANKSPNYTTSWKELPQVITR